MDEDLDDNGGKPQLDPDALDLWWLTIALDRLAAKPLCGYRLGDQPWTEPTALAALALLAHGRAEAARPALVWLEQQFTDENGVGMNAEQREPGWPTGLALLAWRLALQTQEPWAERFTATIDRAARTVLSWAGEKLERNEFVAHDSTLVGWSWIDNTHSWVEPTAIQMLALKAAMKSWPGGDLSMSAASRLNEATRMLWDRQLLHGGWNYGNTFVLKQELRPHLLPTGLALLALADEAGAAQKAEESLIYLARELGARTAPLSQGYGLLALTAYNRRPSAADWWLQFSAERALAGRSSPPGLALLALAARQDAAPFLPVRTGATK